MTTIVDYVWIGGQGELRSKTRVLYQTVNNLSDIPVWNYDGSSTDQADGGASEIYLQPRRIFKCPFKKPDGLIVLCDTYMPNGQPAKYNHRNAAEKIFKQYADQEPWYGLEQEYFIFGADHKPLGFDPAKKQGPYYCSVGGQNAFGRQISDEHMLACMYAGIKVSGTNSEVAPGQWEFQIGPVEGIDAADQLWIARYLLEKISEKYQTYIVYHPKPLAGDWNGSGCHTNFSTKVMREPGGYQVILDVMPKLEKNHLKHMQVYGVDNKMRMTGLHETSSYHEFTFGVGSRKTSIRIPNDTVKNDMGYFEDRRPAANIDPYQVTSIILKTINSI